MPGVQDVHAPCVMECLVSSLVPRPRLSGVLSDWSLYVGHFMDLTNSFIKLNIKAVFQNTPLLFCGEGCGLGTRLG